MGDAQCVPPVTAQSILPIKKRVAAAVDNDHVLIYARSNPRNHTSNKTEADPRQTNSPLADIYTMHFLTNCQWNKKDQAQKCSEAWNFSTYMFGSEYMGNRSPNGDSEKDDDFAMGPFFLPVPYPLKRNAAHFDASKDDEKNITEIWKKMIHNRQAFSKVHLTGCVLVGVSFLCTAVSFFILPALGQWISVGNLALATLATIFLLTSSIFTAVLAKETGKFFDHKDSEYTAKPSGTLGALV